MNKTSILALVFIFGIPQFGINPLYNEIDLLVRSYGYGSIITVLIFFVFLTLITDLINTPFGLYRTFVIE